MTRILWALFLGSFALFSSVQAASLTAFYTVGGVNQACGGSGLGSGSFDQDTPGCAEYIYSGTIMAFGSGSASHDTLRATARVGLTDYDPKGALSNTGILANARGIAGYDDNVVIDIPGRTGETVELEFLTSMGGSMSAIGDPGFVFGQADATLRVNVNGYGVLVSRNAKSEGVPAANDFNPGRVEIELGKPFPVSADLDVKARLQRNFGNTQFFSGDVISNFTNSAGITSFMLYEAGEGGALISDWDLTSESGQFGFYTAVPIPGAVWLFGSAIGILGWMRRKQSF